MIAQESILETVPNEPASPPMVHGETRPTTNTHDCPKCHGCLVSEEFKDFKGAGRFHGFRCLNCGKIVDPVVQVNSLPVNRTIGARVSVF